jgi:hypothetical protein
MDISMLVGGREQMADGATTFCWSTLSCPAFVNDGPSKLCLRDLSLSSCSFGSSVDGRPPEVSSAGSAMLLSFVSERSSSLIFMPQRDVVEVLPKAVALDDEACA